MKRRSQVATSGRRKRHSILIAMAISCSFVGGCDVSMKTSTPFRPSSSGKERWTILCAHINAAQIPNHADYCKKMAAMLGQVQGLRANKVKVETTVSGSTLSYGKYTKIASKETGQLVFPPEFQQDIEMIRSLTYQPTQSRPFLAAHPKLIVDETTVSSHAVWEVSNAVGTYGLQLAVFYNTPTFSERRKTAEEYVRLLRERGFAAYFYHEPVKSFVFVGDFNESDLVDTPNGWQYGPRVQQLVAQNKDEFQYFTENGHVRKYQAPDGTMVAPHTQLVRLPARKPSDLGAY